MPKPSPRADDTSDVLEMYKNLLKNVTYIQLDYKIPLEYVIVKHGGKPQNVC